MSILLKPSLLVAAALVLGACGSLSDEECYCAQGVDAEICTTTQWQGGGGRPASVSRYHFVDKQFVGVTGSSEQSAVVAIGAGLAKGLPVGAGTWQAGREIGGSTFTVDETIILDGAP